MCEQGCQVAALYQEVLGSWPEYAPESESRFDPSFYIGRIIHSMERLGDRASGIAEAVLDATQDARSSTASTSEPTMRAGGPARRPVSAEAEYQDKLTAS